MKLRYDTTALVEKVNKSNKRKVDLAAALGMSKQVFNMKLHGRSRFNVKEAYTLCLLIGIPLEEMCNYFDIMAA